MIASLRLGPPLEAPSATATSREVMESSFAVRIPFSSPGEGSNRSPSDLTSRHIIERRLDDVDLENFFDLSKLLPQIPSPLRELLESFQNGEEFDDVEENSFEDFLSFVQNLKDIDFSSIAQGFDSASTLARLFNEIASLNLNFSNIHSFDDLPRPDVLPQILSSLYNEIRLISCSGVKSFFSLPENLSQTPTIKALYLELEQLARPIIGLSKIKNLGESDIPPHFSCYTREILRVKANPLTDLIAAVLAYSIGFAPVSLMGATLSETTNLSSPVKFALATAPIITGSFACFFTGKQADKNGGKKTTLFLLGAEIIGIAALAALVSFIDLSKMENFSLASLGVTASGATAGVGIAIFPIAMAMAMRSGKINDAAKRQGFTGGFGNIAPGVALFFQALITATLGLKYAYYTWLGTTMVGTVVSSFLLNDSVYHQLIHQEVPKEKARKIAKWMGQELLPDVSVKNIFSEFKRLNHCEKTLLALFSANHVLGGGGSSALTATLPLYFLNRNVSSSTSLVYSGSFALISAITRTLMGKTPLENHGSLTTNLGLVGSLIASTVMAFSPDIRISLIALAALGISNGLLKYGVFALIREMLPQKIGYATGVVGGLGTLGAPLISLAFGGLTLLNRSSDTAYEYLLLSLLASGAFLGNVFLMPKNSAREQGALT